MRLSIVCDDNGTILSASDGDDVPDRPVPGPGENAADLDIPDDLPMPVRMKAVERPLVDLDAEEAHTAHG
jgi:hypothetical protein